MVLTVLLVVTLRQLVLVPVCTSKFCLKMVDLPLEPPDLRTVLFDHFLLIRMHLSLIEAFLPILNERLRLDHKILSHGVPNLASSLRVLQSVKRLLVVGVKLADAGEHDGFRVAAERIFQEAREFAVTIADKSTLSCLLLPLIAQRVDAVPQGQKTLVDVCTFYHTLAAVVGDLRALGPGKIY